VVDERLRENFPLKHEGQKWDLTFLYEVIAGRLEWSGLSVEPQRASKERRSLEHQLIRSVRFAELADKGRKRLLRRYPDLLTEPDLVSAVPELTAEPERRRRGRPPAYGPNHYIEVRRVYVDAYRRHRGPTKAVADHFDVPLGTAANWVRKLRDLKMLTPATEIGKASGPIEYGFGDAHIKSTAEATGVVRHAKKRTQGRGKGKK
jgi:hypothetical protein